MYTVYIKNMYAYVHMHKLSRATRDFVAAAGSGSARSIFFRRLSGPCLKEKLWEIVSHTVEAHALKQTLFLASVAHSRFGLPTRLTNALVMGCNDSETNDDCRIGWSDGCLRTFPNKRSWRCKKHVGGGSVAGSAEDFNVGHSGNKCGRKP